MPKAKKLPSGSWRCQVFSHYEDIFQKDGTVKRKRVYKSFTVEDPSSKGKKKCESMATDWLLEREPDPLRRLDYSYMTVRNAIDQYIRIKERTLSPSTIRNYKQMARNCYTYIGDIRVEDLRSNMVQKWINDMIPFKSPKFISNINGLMMSSICYFFPDKKLKVSLPKKGIAQTYVPTDADINQLISYLAETDPELLRAVYLAAFGTLRRSEICGLEAKDIDFETDTVHVRKVRIEGEKGKVVDKNIPKTAQSDRYVQMPPGVLDSFPRDGFVVSYAPGRISRRFRKAVSCCGLPSFRFHDLRHYAASVMHAIGVPDQYIMKRGGWSSDSTLKRIYRGSMDDYDKHFTALTNDHYLKLMQHDMQHEDSETA